MEHNTDRKNGFLTPIEPCGVNVRSLDDNTDQRHYIGSGDAAKDNERQQEPHIVIATSAPTLQPILPKGARRIGKDKKGGAVAGLRNRRKEWSNGHKQQVIPGLVRRTRIRRGHSTARTEEDVIEDIIENITAASTKPGLRCSQPSQMQPQGSPKLASCSSVRNSDEAADEGGDRKHPKRRLGRPRTRTQAFIAGGVALRAIQLRKIQHKQEDIHTKETLRPGGGRGALSPGREARIEKGREHTAICTAGRSARIAHLERHRPGDVTTGTGDPGRVSTRSRVRDNIDLECVPAKEEDGPGRQRRAAGETDSLGRPQGKNGRGEDRGSYQRIALSR
ncbi:hypothetical protein BGZ61DRAFT_488071 [Ilyonectria robusta]|uniref:uncharacterized protein n=1 Tax=Ilyonectria robusta TaxID=1079257 RepID=UPI001E8E0F46|nr:uncharacterized protein BGZ61DRAFT_488071 [Ilyonectria robusta]KAH8648254.1 hypothetical protein BGZ61DRAFT_488071 [Ilyonectria robusta]